MRRVAHHVFVPFTVGGGIRSVDDMFEVLKAGAEKISVDSMAVRNPDIIRQGAEAFGRQCIVLTTQVKHVGIKRRPSERVRGVHRRRAPRHGPRRVDWVRRGEDLGAGEIVVNSIDRDGTASGYDLDITRAVADAVNVPVIASGGAGTVEHIADGLTAGGAQAAIISSILYSPRLERNLGVRELKNGARRARRADAALGRRPEPSARRSRRDRGHVGPQPVEVVVRAGLVEEHVHDDVAVVEEHPRRVVESLDRDRLRAVARG